MPAEEVATVENAAPAPTEEEVDAADASTAEEATGYVVGGDEDDKVFFTWKVYLNKSFLASTVQPDPNTVVHFPSGNQLDDRHKTRWGHALL